VNETTSLAGDLDLVRRTSLVLHTRGICGAEQVAISAQGGIVVLCGKLGSPHAKWQCLECCRHVAGVLRIIDQIHIPEVAPNSPISRETRDDVVTTEPSPQRRRRVRNRQKGTGPA
jgi:hypothetical protein